MHCTNIFQYSRHIFLSINILTRLFVESENKRGTNTVKEKIYKNSKQYSWTYFCNFTHICDHGVSPTLDYQMTIVVICAQFVHGLGSQKSCAIMISAFHCIAAANINKMGYCGYSCTTELCIIQTFFIQGKLMSRWLRGQVCKDKLHLSLLD